ncbi:MAG TPA: hypothetical protein PKA95_15555 [Thermomicrobiales bacterium]|nr:hypothetical protein [Thermomicrobiales bacterium]
MPTRTTNRSIWSMLLLSAVAVLLVAGLAACGSDSTDEATATSATTGSTAATSPAGTAASPATDMGEVGAIGSCLQEQTTPAMVQELRDGTTATATGVYRDCLETALPASLVAQAEPIIQQTADCGVTASKGLTDEQMQQIEAGDQATIQSLTQSTLACVSDQLGIPLQ